MKGFFLFTAMGREEIEIYAFSELTREELFRMRGAAQNVSPLPLPPPQRLD
jgi:hypothetical protein